MGDSGNDPRERFEALAVPLMRRLYVFARHLEGQDGAAQDLVQETFLRAYRTFHNFRPGTNAKAWLFKIMYSIHVNAARRRQRRPLTLSMERADGGTMEIADWSGVVATLTNPAIHWRGSEVEHELSALPEEFRQVVLLVDIGELTYEEAAAVLGCPVGTIGSRLARARRRLAARLHELARSRGLVKE